MEKNKGGGVVAQKSRIFLGGLGKNVTEGEIRKTFCGLGEVESVEIVRTKGRSFAYLDFLPSNEKSLSKLYSTYNGCLWKGGRLKLEKAKEHYLIGLKREWADAQLAKSLPGSDDASESKLSLEKPKKSLTLEKSNLRIFFPKLNKMKSVPFSGSGKHKYSFQRIEVPSLPIHFCDCEEHYSSHPEKGRHFDLETAHGGIREEEIDIMESVMKKLFESKINSEAVLGEGRSSEERDNSAHPVDPPVDEDISDPPSDEDNLIINVVGGGNKSMPLLGKHARKTIGAKQELGYSRSNASQDGPVDNLHTKQREKLEAYNKKRKSSLAEVSEGNELGSFDTKRKKSSQITTREQADQSGGPESRTRQSTNNISWSQKSAWKDLVGKKGDSPFQISNIAPNVSTTKEKPQNSQIMPNIPSANVEQPLISPTIQSTEEELQPRYDDLNVTYPTSGEDQNILRHENLESETVQSKNHRDAEVSALPNVSSIKAARGASWRQKSSWTQLVADANKNSFSISQVLPGLSFGKQEPLQPNGTDAATNTRDADDQNLLKLDQSEHTGHSLEKTNISFHATPSNSGSITPSKGTVESEQNTAVEAQPTVTENDTPTHEVGQPSRRKPISISDFGETCSFMRNADSLKEWAKAKAALSNSLKKKGDKK